MEDAVEPAERYQPGHTPEVLRFMARRSAATHATHFTPLLLPGLRVLDVACGPGTMTVDFARIVGPTGSVVGVDKVGDQFHIGADLAMARGLENVTFQEADAYALPFPDGSFDRLFCNALLEHVADPVAIARKFRRVLAPGGAIGLATPDWDGFVYAPPSAGLLGAAELYQQIQAANGGDPTVGRRLGDILDDAGFTDIHMGGRYENYEDRSEVGDYLAWRFDRWAEEPDATAIIPAERLRGAAETIRAWVALPYGMFAQTWIWATASVPED